MSARAHDGCWCRTQRFEGQPSSARVAAKVARQAPSVDGVAEWGDPLFVATFGVDWDDDDSWDIDMIDPPRGFEFDTCGCCYVPTAEDDMARERYTGDDTITRLIDGMMWSNALQGGADLRQRLVATDGERDCFYTIEERAAAFGLVPTYAPDAHSAFDLGQQRELLDEQARILTTIHHS